MNANDHDRRLDEVAAYALGALDAGQVDEFRHHLEGCELCQEELAQLEPAVRMLPEAVAQQPPPAALRRRLMNEVRAEAKADGRERSSRSGFGEWLRGLRVGGMTWRPLAGMAAAILIVAGGVGYAVGTGSGGGSDATHTWEVEPSVAGVQAKVVREGERGELRLAGVEQPAKGKVLEAWVKRDGKVEPVPALFAPNKAGDASTTIEDMHDVSIVMVTEEPAGGSEKPTAEPIVEVPLET